MQKLGRFETSVQELGCFETGVQTSHLQTKKAQGVALGWHRSALVLGGSPGVALEKATHQGRYQTRQQHQHQQVWNGH